MNIAQNPNTTPSPLILTESLYINKGEDRRCYQHPHDPSRCIKVTVTGDFRQHRDENKYFGKAMRRQISWQHLARWYGEVQTDRGLGQTFELIRDQNGSISRSMTDYLTNQQLPISLETFQQLMQQLIHYLLREKIIFRNLSPDNILLKHQGEQDYTLIIIDGIGNNEFIPLSNVIAPLRRRKIIRKWNRFVQRLVASYPYLQDSQHALLYE